MKRIFDNIFKGTLSNLFHYEASNSHNKTEYHFHGPVNFIGKPPKKLKINPPTLRQLKKKTN